MSPAAPPLPHAPAAPVDCPYLSQEDYLRERTILIEAEQKGAEQHDKAILTLAAGALALSLAFLEKVAPSPRPETFAFVGVAWAAFVVCIVLMVASFLSSQRACQQARELLDAMFSEQSEQTPRTGFSVLTRWFNRVSYLSFVVGVASLAAFGWWNLPRGANGLMSEEKQSQTPVKMTDPAKKPGGSVPPKPPATPRKPPKK